MKRLVYAPKIEAWVKTDFGIYDLKNLITAGTVTRKLDQVSNAELTIRNPEFQFTDKEYRDRLTKESVIGPIFHPMDPIVITLQRLENRPVQVFTGFLDTTPYVQLFPGTVTLKASCTLKKLLYTYYDPGLPFFNEFLAQYGWENVTGFGAVNPKDESAKAKAKGEVNETALGEVLYGVLTEIGGWPDKAIYIEKIPSDLMELVSRLFEETGTVKEAEEGNKQIKHTLHKIIGTASLGSGVLGPPSVSPIVGTSSGEAPKSEEPCTALDVGRAMLAVGFKADPVILAKGMTTVEHESAFGTAAGWDQEHTGGVLGYWQIQQSTHPQYSPSCCMNLMCSTKAAYEISEHGTNWDPWSASDFAMSDVPASAYEPYIATAEKAIKMGPFKTTVTGTST